MGISLAGPDRPDRHDRRPPGRDRPGRRDGDGHRAWVIRDTLAKLDPAVADELRARLAGIRKRPGAPATSIAAETAARFGDLPDPTTHPEPPLALTRSRRSSAT